MPRRPRSVTGVRAAAARLVRAFAFASAFAVAWLALALPAAAQQLAPIPALDAPVIDTTGTLSPAQREQLVRQALDLQQRKGSQLQVLLVPTTQPEDIAQYAQRAYDQWKLGRKGVDDGLLVVVAKDDRRARIQPGYGLEGAIPDATAARVIQEYMAPKFRAGDYGGGLVDATAVLVKLVDGEALPAPVAGNAADGGDPGGAWLFAMFAVFVVAQVARGFFSWAPTPLRALAGAGAGAGIAYFITHALLVAVGGALFGLLIGAVHLPGGRYARRGGPGGWGGFGGGPGGGWGGGGFGGGGGGWSGGGGMSGGGGASGGW